MLIRSTFFLLFLSLSFTTLHAQDIAPKEITGQLSEQKSKMLFDQFATDGETAELIAIHFHYGNGINHSLYKNHETYGQKFHKIANSQPHYFYRSNVGLEVFEGKIDWKRDTSKQLQRMLFKKAVSGGSYILIDQNGNYILGSGAYETDKILKQAKKMKKAK